MIVVSLKMIIFASKLINLYVMTKNLFMLFALLASGVFVCSCDSDDNYSVSLPVYQDVVFTQGGVQVSSRNIAVGRPVTATLVQGKKGDGIYRYSYLWSSDDANSGLVVFSQDKTDNSDVSCTFTPAVAGSYVLTVEVDYNYSGNKAPKAPKCEIADGTVVYSVAGDLYGKATITKNITVK